MLICSNSILTTLCWDYLIISRTGKTNINFNRRKTLLAMKTAARSWVLQLMSCYMYSAFQPLTVNWIGNIHNFMPLLQLSISTRDIIQILWQTIMPYMLKSTRDQSTLKAETMFLCKATLEPAIKQNLWPTNLLYTSIKLLKIKLEFTFSKISFYKLAQPSFYTK